MAQPLRRIPSCIVAILAGGLLFGCSSRPHRATEAQAPVLQAVSPAQHAPGLPIPTNPTADSLMADRVRHARAVVASIAGRENEPAGQVFKNLKRLENVPAIRIPAIMNTAYAKSLGVSCSHCHIPDDYASDAKPQKQIARDMAEMMSRLNTQMLAAIPNLKGPNPVVNCTTCHRGSLKPALDIP